MGHILRFGAAVLIVQLAFWFILEPALFARPDFSKLPRYQTYAYQAASLEGPDESALSSADWQPIDGPGWYDCCAPGYRAIRYSFDIDDIPEEGIALLYDMGGDNAVIRINGSSVIAKGRMQLPDISYNAQLRSVEHIPAGILDAGRNEVSIVLVRDSVPYFDFNPPLIGPYSEVSSALAWRAFVLSDLTLICITAGFLIAAFTGILALQSHARKLPLALFGLALIWSLRTHYFQWADMPFHGNWRLTYYFVLSGLAPFAWLILADQWCASSRKWLLTSAATGAVLVLGALLLSLWLLPTPDGYDATNPILDWTGLIVSALTVLRLGWHFATRLDTRYWEAALFVLLIVLTGFELIFDRAGYFTLSQPFILGAFVIAFFSRNIQLFRSREQIAGTLAAELSIKEAELKTYFEREAELTKERTLIDERKRIMRDMHDGLGSRLFGIAAQLRAGCDANPAKAADGIMQVIEELRLIVDSLDTAGDDIGMALGAFRARIEPKMKAAGIEIEWNLEDVAASAEFSASEILDVFRMLQEISTNALRHSGAEVFRIALGSDRKDLVLTISDDGHGFDETKPGGHGLRNLRARADRIGAKFGLQSSEAGTVLTIRFQNRISGQLPPADTSLSN